MGRFDDILEIGAATRETKGPAGPILEFKLGMMITGMGLD